MLPTGRTSPLFRARSPQRLTRRRYARRGATFVEFALAGVTFLALFLACFDWNYSVFVRTALRHAVREGIRQGIAAQSANSVDHEGLVRSAVVRNSFGLIDPASSTRLVQVRYYGQDGVSAAVRREERRYLSVSVERFPASRLGLTGGIARVSVQASDRMLASEGTTTP